VIVYYFVHNGERCWYWAWLEPGRASGL